MSDAKMLESIKAALKSKSPIVAVPVEGRAPICLKSQLLKRALKGVEILSVSANDTAEFSTSRFCASTSVVVKGRAPASWSDARITQFRTIHGRRPTQDEIGYIRTSCRIFAVARANAIKLNRDWAEKERKTRERESLQGALSAKARAQAKNNAKRAELEKELLAEANQERQHALQRIKRAISATIPVPAKIAKDGERFHSDTAHSAYVEDSGLWRTSKRERGNVGRIRRELSQVRERIYELTGRKSERVWKRGKYVDVWKGRRRKIRGAVVSELIALVRRAVDLRAAYERAIQTLPLRPRYEGYGEGLARLLSTEKPKIVYAHWQCGHDPVYAPPKSEQFARAQWEKDRKERASMLAEAMRVLRDNPEVTAESLAA